MKEKEKEKEEVKEKEEEEEVKYSVKVSDFICQRRLCLCLLHQSIFSLLSVAVSPLSLSHSLSLSFSPGEVLHSLR